MIVDAMVAMDDLMAARVEQAQGEAQQACEALMKQLEECATPAAVNEMLIRLQGLRLSIDQIGKAFRRNRS